MQHIFYRFLRSEGYDKTMLYFIVELTYLVSFLFLRGVLGSYIIYKVLQSDLFDLDEKIISLIFYFVSLAFIYDIFGYIFYKYKARIVSIYNKSSHNIKH